LSSSSQRTTAVVAVAALLAVEIAGIVAFLVWGFHSRSDASTDTSQDSNRSAAVAAAEQFALRMDDFQAPSADQYQARIEEMLTTKGKADFAQVKSVIGQVFTATQPTAQQAAQGTTAPTGHIVYAGVSDIDADSATVLVAHDAGVNGSSKSLHFRWTVTLKKIGKTWLVDGLPPEVSGSQAQ
jgi:hypothetical protein